MRLHRLEITAFGPFSGTEEIDFDALSGAGLFLIQGQTGAGKTSVLDAVCFALYGQVPGVRNAIKNLRSDHAAPHQAPRVVLETTIRGRRFRISRSPAWERPKKRGTGTTTEHAAVILEEFENGEWIGLSTRLDEVGDLIGRLLGMTAAQFCQVAMLPQGEFASFLRAGAEERRKVLERLFATEVFTQVEKWLADRRAATRREAADLRSAAESVADRIAEATGTQRPGRSLVPEPRHPEPADESLDDIEVLPAWAVELAGHHETIRITNQTLLEEASAVSDKARAALESARTLAERQHRHAEALGRRAALEERAEERSRLTARLDAAARADRVVALIKQVRERTERAKLTHREANQTRSRVASLVTPGAAADVLAKAERERRDDIAALEGKRGSADRLRRITSELADLVGERERLEPEEARLAATLNELPGLVDEQRAQLDEARIVVAGRSGAEAVLQETARRLDAARRRDQVTARLGQAEETLRDAIDVAQQARERFQDLRQARLEGMAATLAEDLNPGEPCRVCGSTDHPAPASSLGLIPGEEDEERAHAAYEQAQSRREEASGAVESLRAERDAVLEVAGEADTATLGADVTEAQETLAAIDARVADVERMERLVHQSAQELEQARDRRDEIARVLTANRARRGELSAEQTRLAAELDEARGDDPTLEARIERLGHEADALADAVQALQAADRAAEELAAARARAKQTAADEGFATPDEVMAAALEDEDQAALRDRIRRFENEEAAVKELLADRDLTTAAAQPAPDVPALEAALAIAETTRTTAASAADRAHQRRVRLTELRTELAARVHAWRPAAEQHALAARLAGLASGQSGANRLSMRLSAYVLAARLEQVVAAANERLARMSAGRYALLHTTDKAAGDRRGGSGGLGLRIVDAWTGQERDPVTLSGGESFITSLALALGLADVVTAEAGGTEINTLFVDEGFGTLDEETLDEVMDVLDALRDGGRAVGIVSHVAELRTRIPAQLRISKQRTGSTAAVTV
ncbi:AAA family ATPase [Actinomadura rudentiformis]|uniref:Nuclease SbcCD subunit C n=1 Tax=Actinomadura rudentiformis TaxID=359158 RepID=A0A6H9YGB2_9ACTN|nr:SMC family ATPase [Actinomadura rudentiformis]KAB2345222.1 SMC family ATPase [Actinomadura rudentiformis]